MGNANSTWRLRKNGDYCQRGVVRISDSSSASWTAYCCAASCGTCGGTGCSSRSGGSTKCCTSRLFGYCSSPLDTVCIIANAGETILDSRLDRSSLASSTSSSNDDDDK